MKCLCGGAQEGVIQINTEKDISCHRLENAPHQGYTYTSA